MHTRLLMLALAAACLPGWLVRQAQATDWPQFQGNPQRTGYTADSVVPPFRARWIWLGPTQTLKSHASNSAWPDDLTTRDGYNYPMPASVDFTISELAQPVVADGRVFVGDQQGNAYGISGDDGSTLWSASLPGGTTTSAAVSGNAVIFVSSSGAIRGYDAANGAILWTVDAGRTINAAPLVFGGMVYVADHGGTVWAINPANGGVNWRRKLPAPVQGGLAGSGNRVYVCAENMTVYALSAADGSIVNSRVVTGQSFRMTWPVISGNLIYVQAGMIPIMGSENITEDVCLAATSIADEVSRFLEFQSGQGGYQLASPDWDHLHALNLADLAEPFQIGCGPTEGVGYPPEPPVIRGDGKALCYWKTKYPKLTRGIGMYGTKYAADISAIDPANGNRLVIDNGHVAGIRLEADNMYAMSIGGKYLFLRQRFRGTQGIDLATSTYRYVTQQVRYKDGGGYASDIAYDSTNDSVESVPATPTPASVGRCPVTISGTRLFIVEPFCVTAIEHY